MFEYILRVGGGGVLMISENMEWGLSPSKLIIFDLFV